MDAQGWREVAITVIPAGDCNRTSLIGVLPGLR